MAAHAVAQSPAQPIDASVVTSVKARASAPKALTTAANVKAPNPASARTVTAAGSVVILADGILTNATFAQIQPPAPGFVYER